MATIDSLPPDQRAVLQLVLQRGRSYDEIANLLSIDRAAVRQRALDALQALTPAGAGSAAAERSLITDYLLGQLPSGVANQVHALLQTSAADNQWARAIRRELADFGGHAAEIPQLRALKADAAAGRQPADPGSQTAPAAPLDEPNFEEPTQTPVQSGPPPRRPDAAAAPAEASDPGPAADQRIEPEDELWFDDADEPQEDLAQSYRRSERERPAGSRRGGLVLLGIAAVAVVVIVLLVAGVFSGGSGNPSAHNSSDPGNGHSTKSDSKTSSANTAKYLAQINLTAPDGAKKPAGIVQVVEETLDGKTSKGIVVYALGVPANTKQNAYAVWLSSPGGASKFIGFVPKLVGTNGKLQTEGALPSDATDYKQILVTLETAAELGSAGKPTKPGTVVLSGAFTETAKAK